MKHRVLVLGGGQVGTFSARAIAREGGSVVTADLQPATAYFRRFGPRPVGELVQMDITDYSSVRALLRRSNANVVVLCAGRARTHSDCATPAAWDAEIHQVRTACLAAVEQGVRRVVFVSSLAVYGRPAVKQIFESNAVRPVTRYGRMKVAAEAIVAATRQCGIDVRILRSCGLYGPVRPGSGSHSSRLIDLLLLYCLSGRPLTLEAAGSVADQYLYVKDLSRAVALATLRDIKSPHFVFNVGPGVATTIQELCTALSQVVPRARVTTISGRNRRRPMAPLDVSRLKATLGFEPRYSLVSGLKDYLRSLPSLQEPANGGPV